jgi:hypothetical protein
MGGYKGSDGSAKVGKSGCKAELTILSPILIRDPKLYNLEFEASVFGHQ